MASYEFSIWPIIQSNVTIISRLRAYGASFPAIKINDRLQTEFKCRHILKIKQANMAIMFLWYLNEPCAKDAATAKKAACMLNDAD
jgi:hypothetical protein